MLSKEMYEKLIKYYPVEQLLLKGTFFIPEMNFLAVAKAMQSCYQDGILLNFYYHMLGIKFDQFMKKL